MGRHHRLDTWDCGTYFSATRFALAARRAWAIDRCRSPARVSSALQFLSGPAIQQFHEVIRPQLVHIAKIIPLFFVGGALWAYLTIEKEQRNLRSIAARFLPRSDFAGHSFSTDLKLTVPSLVIIPFIFSLFSKMTAALVTVDAVSIALQHRFGVYPYHIHSTFWLLFTQGTALFVINDLVDYFSHRLTHRVHFLWAFHRLHHSAESLTPATALGRFHPVDSIFGVLMGTIFPALLLGIVVYLTSGSLSPKAAAWMTPIFIFFTATGTFEHTRVRVSFGRLNHLFISPVVHQIHHSAEIRHRDKNFGSTLAIWDWMFGTLYIPAREEKWRFGLNEDELGDRNPHKGAIASYIEPFVYAWLLARSPVKRATPSPCHDALNAAARQ